MISTVFFAVGMVLASASRDEVLPDGTVVIEDSPFPLATGSVREMGLLSPKLTWQAYVEHQGRHGPNVRESNYRGEVLGYVTPWNSAGYDVAKTFASKYSWISPVWLQLRSSLVEPVVTGLQDVDREWMSAVRENGGCNEAEVTTCPKIVPRLAWEARQLSGEGSVKAQSMILDALQEMGADGVVLEMPVRNSTIGWIRSFSKQARALNLSTILVLPPSLPSKGLVNALASSVTRFSLMTYDYSSSRGKAGPDSPLGWIQDVVKRMREDGSDDKRKNLISSRLLLGIALYGRHDTEPVLANQIANLLQTSKPRIKYNSKAGAHIATVQEKQLHFPTPYSVQKRINASMALHTRGIALWELGQGPLFIHDLY